VTYTKQTYEIQAKKPYLFIGSKVRGGFGYALKEEVCINPSFTCKDCFASKECIFYKMYELQNVTHDYRLDFKLESEKYKFSLLLFNELQEHKKLIQTAMLRSLSYYKEIEFKEKAKKLKAKNFSPIIKISFLTPLRIKKQNRFATDDIELLDILVSIKKRYQALHKLSDEKLDISQNFKVVSKNFRYQELVRRSNKQDTKMNMGGLMGEMIISNIDKKTYELLKLGEIIGVGKSTVFGLGKITIEEIH
jgi:CRISPR-associated endoribonuclease Cas6